MPLYQTRTVLGGSYRGSDREMLTHLVEVDEEGLEIKTCSGVKLDNIADVYSSPGKLRSVPTCPVCARKHDTLVRKGQLEWLPLPDDDLTPNRALTRQKLEMLAWQQTPADYRSSTGGHRRVLINTTEGTTLVPLGDMTDYQLRRYIGAERLQEEGDMRKNPARRSGPADETAARELCLYIENDGDLYRQHTLPIQKNLLRKIKAGTFDLDKSEQAWSYLVEAGAKKYAREFASASEWSKLFNPATRELCAHYFASDFYDNYKASEFSEAATPNARIERITSANVTRYRDNGQTIAYVSWIDTRGGKGTTIGDPESAHMQALLARAKREGITVRRTTAG